MPRDIVIVTPSDPNPKIGPSNYEELVTTTKKQGWVISKLNLFTKLLDNIKLSQATTKIDT
jgi:hypothetical protein